MGRAPCCDKSSVKKGPWSPEEDAKLKAYIEQHGTGGNWIALPQKIGLKRCGKSCRLRWLNYLRPNIKHGGFSEDEDNIICSLYITIGSRWSIIASQLPGRTDNDIKNYWNTRLKKKLLGKQKKDNNNPQVPRGKQLSITKATEEHQSNFAAINGARATTGAYRPCLPLPSFPINTTHQLDQNASNDNETSIFRKLLLRLGGFEGENREDNYIPPPFNYHDYAMSTSRESTNHWVPFRAESGNILPPLHGFPTELDETSQCSQIKMEGLDYMHSSGMGTVVDESLLSWNEVSASLYTPMVATQHGLLFEDQQPVQLGAQ